MGAISVGWPPVVYQYRPLPFVDLVALYSAANIALVTPLRDGMNLVAKEYVASKPEGTGVLILSEMTGAARELGEALQISFARCPRMPGRSRSAAPGRSLPTASATPRSCGPCSAVSPSSPPDRASQRRDRGRAR